MCRVSSECVEKDKVAKVDLVNDSIPKDVAGTDVDSKGAFEYTQINSKTGSEGVVDSDNHKGISTKPLLVLIDRIGVDLSNIRTGLKRRGLRQASCIATIPMSSQDVNRVSEDEFQNKSEDSFKLNVGSDKAAVKLSEILDADFVVLPANCISDVESNLHLVRPIVVVNVTEDKASIQNRLEKHGVSSIQAEAMIDKDLHDVKSVYVDRTISLSRYVLGAVIDEIEEFYKDMCNQYKHADFSILEMNRRARRRKLAKYGMHAEDIFRTQASLVLLAILIVFLLMVSMLGEHRAVAMKEFVTDTQQKVINSVEVGIENAVENIDLNRS